MAKFDEISRLYDETAAKVTESPEEWLKFVGTASNLYRYPFEDQLLIYAQRPDAKQAATMDFWNKELHCYVNKGAKGIALLDKSKRGNRLKYVFDMSDVHKVSDRSRMPYQWELSDAFKNDVADYLEGKHIGYASTDMDFEDRIIRIADHIAADNIDEFYDSISGKTDGSALSEVYEENRKEVVQDALSASVASMLLTRCGLDPSECEDRLTGLQYINMFNTKSTVDELGNLTSTLAKPVLIDIEREVFRLSREKNIQVDNIINKEHNQSKESERSEENGSRVHTERGLSDTEPESTGNIGRDTGSIDESREIRTGEGEIPARTQEGDLLGLSDERNTGGTPDRDRQTGIRTERADDAANEESKGRESRNAGKELVGVLSGGSDDRSRGGLDDNGRDDLRLEENEDKQLSLFPTEKEQVESIEAAEKSAAFSLDEIRTDIERAVRNHDTIYVGNAETPQNDDTLYPVADARKELFFNERIEYVGEQGTMLLLGDTETGKDWGLYAFRKTDEDPARAAKDICDYLESHQKTVTGIVVAEDLEKHDYIFRTYAGVSVHDPMTGEQTISAHSIEEAQKIAEELARGQYFTVNAAYEVEQEQPVRAEAVSVGDIAEFSPDEKYLADMNISYLAQRFAKSAVAYDELESLGLAFYGTGDDWNWERNKNIYLSSSAIFGNNLHGDELMNLSLRFQDGFTEGTDEQSFDRDLALGIMGEKGIFNADGVSSPDLTYEFRDGSFIISAGDVSREVSSQMVSNALLTMAKEEYERNIEQEQEAEQGTFRIYQMKDGEEYHYAHFQNMGTLEKGGIKLNHEDYNLVYEGKLSDVPGSSDSERLEKIFEKFGNSPFEERPADFTGYSISVSDVITFDKGNGEEPYFVDSWGFKDFPAFLQEKEEVKEAQNEEVPLPNVRVEWSESSLFESDRTYTVAEFDRLMHDADLSRHAKQQELIEKYGSWQAWYDSGEQPELLSYEKVKLNVNFKDGTSTVLRQDLGDGIGGLLEFLAPYDQFADKMPELREAAGREEDKTPYQLVVHYRGTETLFGQSNPARYEQKLSYRTEEEAVREGKKFLKESHIVNDGFGVYNLETGENVRSVGKFEPDIPVNDGILGEEFKEKYAAGQEKTDLYPYELLSLAIGDHLVDDKGVLWTVTNNGNFLLSIEKAEENVVDTLQSARSFTNWQNTVKETGNIDEFDHYRKITVEDYLAEQGSQGILSDEVRVGHYEQRIKKASTLEELRGIEYGLMDDENLPNRLRARINEMMIGREGELSSSSRYTITEWTDEDINTPYAIWDAETDDYYYDAKGRMPEFESENAAEAYIADNLSDITQKEAKVNINELTGTEYIVQLPKEEQEKIREAVSRIEGSDIEKAMSGRLTDLEDNINWREVLNTEKGVLNAEVKEQEKSGNFHITDNDLGKGGVKEKYRRNVEAIKTLKRLEEEGRAATPEEQKILSQYIGWGGLPDAFDERKENWHNEVAELKELLTEDEYKAARASTTDSFYTSPDVISGIYGTLDRMGFEKGNILEPSMGVGNFFGMLPEKMQGSKLYGVELDSISGRIGKQLYPDARIQISGYQDTNFSNNSFDVAVGNVPFGDYKPFDRDYKKQNFVLHDYFFAKTLDKVRPGGVIAFVTSKGTMDKEDPKVRKYIAQRAELLGAVRLPGGKDGAFKENAGTEVTSDIIFLQKRDGIADVDPDWVHLSMDKNGITMNSYFAEHPEQIVGHMEMVSGRFGPEAACIADKDKPFKEQYAKALLGINGRYAAAERNGKDTQDYAETLLPSPEDKNYSFIVRNDRVYFRKNTELIPKELKGDAEERIKGMAEIRDLTQNLLNMQLDDAKESEIATAQIKLGEAYDTFVKKYGRINSPKNKSAFQQDSSYSLLRSLEKYDDNNEYQGKSDIFTKRTIQKAVVVSSVESASEALSVCLNEKAAVDIPFMARLCHKPENEVIEDLRGIIFKNPLTERYETSDEYLSGNVRSKLALAKNYAEQNPEYAINVSALEAVQPKELSAGDIDVRLGASWIDPKYINDFMREVLDTSWYEMRNGTIGVSFNDVTASWWIEGKTKDRYNSKVNQVYGTERKNAYELLEDSLNLKATTVYDSWIDENGCRKSEINKQATMAAQQKQDELKETFKSWIFQDPQRRQELVTLYNEKFNSTRPREYNGDYITLPGSNPQITLKPHQKNAVARIISGNNTLLAHCVGAGKTFTMAAAAMESKRLGLCKKSLFVVPNHLTEQWGSEFRTLYPNANILVATKKDFEPARRKEFCARIATGDYDAVIIGHTQFEKIPVSPEKEAAFIQSEIDNAKRTIEELSYSKADRHSVKDIEKFIKKRTEQLDKMLHSKERDDVVTFEQLGVDRLFVDESHKFKNLGMITKMNRVAGVQTSDSQKSNDMLMKCRVMDEITGGKGVIFATGTPISNSMTELYTNMRYLQQSTLEKLDLAHFDKWASTFGETVTAMEVSPEGTSYRAKTRFAKFFNLPELMSIWKEAADVQTPDMLNLPVPETEYVDVVLDKSPEQEAILDVIGKRADVIRAGGIDSKIDNMLKITNDGRKMALDQRLINDMLPDNPNSKAAACAENIASIYKDTMEQKSAQIVFCDLGTPSANGKNDKFNVYNDLKAKLIEKGIPAEEIAFIHDAKTGTQKDTLFSNVRSGKVRVIIGSTEKMGAGTNIQDRLIALHHMDVPWRPADLEQQEGRIIRRGNQNSKVKIFRYITKGTFDTYNWQTIENKQTFIGQIMTSKSPVRSHEDIDNAALKYAEVKALATDNPLIAEKMNLEVEVQKLKAAKASHNNQIYAMQDNVTKTYPESIAKDKEQIKAFKKDIQTYNEHKPADKDSFSITIGNRTFVDKKEGAEALQDAIKSGAKYVGDYGKIGSYRGFDVMVKLDLLFNKFDLKLSGETAHQVMDVGHDAFGNVNKMNNVLDGMPQNLEKIVQRLEKTEKSLEVAKVEMTKPFPKEEELKEKMQRLSEVDSLLRMDEKEPVIIDTGDEIDTPTKACEDISEMIEDKSETKIFGVSYRNEKDFGNMVYLECDNEDTAKDFVKDLIPGCTVERGIEVSKVPDGKQVFNVAKEKERMAQKALEKAGKGKTANGIE